MAGHVRSDQKCCVCGGKFILESTGRNRALVCPVHRTSPTRYYVDTAGFGLTTRKHYKDRDGHLFTSYPHAERYLETMRAAKDSRAGFDKSDWEPAKRKEFKFSVEWSKWTASRASDWSPRYKRQVEWVRTKIVAPRWGGLDMRDVRTAHLIDLKTAVANDKYSPSVVKLVVSVTCAFLSGLRERGDIKELITRPKVHVPARDLYILDADQQTQIINAAPMRFRGILRLAAACGVRPCEVCAVRVRDMVGGYIFFQRSIDDGGFVSDTKTGTIHRKPIPAELSTEIASAKRDKLPETYLYTNRSGKPFRPGVLSRVWKKAADSVGLKGSTLNVGTRHSFATRTWNEEEQAARDRTAEAVGHAGPGTTFKHYIREVRKIGGE